MINNYDELPLGKYLEILKICKDEQSDPVGMQVDIISVLSGKTADEVLQLPLPDYQLLSKQTLFLTLAPATSNEVRREYRIGKWELVAVKDMTKVSAAQYIDFQTFAKGKDEKIPEMLSCMLVPKGMKYNEGYDMSELQKAIRKEMKVPDAMSVYAFFLHSLKKSIRHSLFCLVLNIARIRGIPIREKVKMIQTGLAMRKALIKNGGGLDGSI